MYAKHTGTVIHYIENGIVILREAISKQCGRRRGVVVTELVVSTKLLYVEPG